MDHLNNPPENVSYLQKYLLKEVSKAEKEIESLQKGFKNLIESYRDTIIRKYRKIACEASKNILSVEPELLVDCKSYYHSDSSELVNRLNICIQNCQRDNSNFEYQFNFFKNRLISLHNMAMHKMPNINPNELTASAEDEDSRKVLRQMLQSMTGVIFESSVPLSDKNTDSKLAKVRLIRFMCFLFDNYNYLTLL